MSNAVDVVRKGLQDPECWCLNHWTCLRCQALEAFEEIQRDLAAARASSEILSAAITRALAGCPFCKMGQCRADAHGWLADALRDTPAGAQAARGAEETGTQ